jgi:acetylxylan esterase
MAATYPELFAAGIVYSGVPAGCFYSAAGGTDAWNSTCAQGQVNSTPQNWGNVSSIPVSFPPPDSYTRLTRRA